MAHTTTPRRDVVVTGLGTTNPLAGTTAETWQALLAGTSGIRSLEADWLDQFELPVRFAGTAAVDPATVLPGPQARKMDPSSRLAVVAADEAWADAGSPEVDGERFGVAVASGIGGIHTTLNAWDTMKDKGARRVLPMTVPMLMPNSSAAIISVRLGAKAGAHAPTSACASGAEAIAMGVEMIRNGRADIVLAGGTESAIHPMPIAAFARMMALSTRNDDPQAASRPYDVDRDGFVMGEGAGIVVLESAEHAAARGAKVYASIAGTGMSADAFDVAPPDPTGAGQEHAMRLALADADLSGSDIVHVNAHATSTPLGDGIEAAAISRVSPDAIVSGTKSMTGHLLGGAGAMEAVFSVLAAHHRVAPPTINLDNPEPDLPINVTRNEPVELPAGAVVNNAFGFGGHNVALVITSA
ncbi:3-oxoacyl-[acyl-carrier-protein] synthase II [Bowdeniella nasicola]|uniref:3-oxoacyl-[acyl-carrier-protein] synthase II n=1 Tax=Bowdeniella nasicola TaxID=208480 RepID=A0A1H3W6K1_9ACTO|nr:beta-ketoacyl-[acyl-carrier-protein] synthase family protein [Bowdeniella nasicola]SDZ82725.1 3-oxoacyl-[acyl-carrier-protein] synthase II [Bowdeniella nasicola]